MKPLTLLTHPNAARLIPAFKQPERRLLSVFMALLNLCPSIRAKLLSDVGYGAGKTAKYSSYMEPTFDHPNVPPGRPDGMMCCQRGNKNWSALVEAKRDDFLVSSEQVQKYIELAKFLECDAVISISNEFTSQPTETPYVIPANKTRSRAVYHWSWSYLTNCLNHHIESDEASEDEKAIIREALFFFNEEKSGVKTFDQMPKTWPDFVQAANTNLGFGAQTAGLVEIVHAWHQERRDLAIKLDGLIGGGANLWLPVSQRSDPRLRTKVDRGQLADEYKLHACYEFKPTKVRLQINADLRSCVTQTLLIFEGPENKKAKATVTWLLGLVSKLESSDLQVVIKWPGKSKDTIVSLEELQSFPDAALEENKERPTQITLVKNKQSTRRFKSRKGFIEDLEADAKALTKMAHDIGLI